MACKILAGVMTSIVSNETAENSNVLLLGASGQLGSMLRGFWPTDGQMTCAGRQTKAGWLTFDPVVDHAAFVEAARARTAVICFCGVTPAHAARSGDALSLNTDLALAAVRAAAAARAGPVFLASSAAVYGRAVGPLVETQHCEPVTAYGEAKLGMELSALALGQELDQAVHILRIGNVAGADAILGGWRTGMALDRLADGTTPRRSYIGPVTLARVMHRLTCISDLPPVLNIAAPGTVAMGALLDAAGLAWSPRPASGAVIADVALSTERLESFYNFASDDIGAAAMAAQWRAFCAVK